MPQLCIKLICTQFAPFGMLHPFSGVQVTAMRVFRKIVEVCKVCNPCDGVSHSVIMNLVPVPASPWVDTVFPISHLPLNLSAVICVTLFWRGRFPLRF